MGTWKILGFEKLKIWRDHILDKMFRNIDVEAGIRKIARYKNIKHWKK
jgi:hypothetical protein